jgi:alpha-beta hydrolase superfamily lysophospholipase
MKNGMENQTPEQILASQKTYLPTMISSQEKIDFVAAIAMKADSKTQAQVMYELMTTDLRETIATIDCPVLVLGAWIAYKNYGVTHDSIFKAQTDQMKAAKNVKVEINDTAKHFIFYDEPTWYYEKCDAFLKS